MSTRRIVTADEQDAYTGWRHHLCYLQQAGAVKRIKRIKRSTHRRERREGHAEIRTQQLEDE